MRGLRAQQTAIGLGYSRSEVAERPPPQPPEEVLEELDDDAIVAQQATAHSPAPRVQISDEVRTIVVTEPPPPAADDTARVQRLEPGRNDPTMVLRAVRAPAPAAPIPARAGLPGWVPWLLWGLAGLLAFGLGAFLALSMGKRDGPAPPASAVKPAIVNR